MSGGVLSKSRVQWELSHGRILAAAGALFRTSGFAGASVERVMRRAGLTVGGFYAHFKNKQALLVEALRDLLRLRRIQWLNLIGDRQGDEFAARFVRVYLSRLHRDTPAEGCPVPALLSELAAGPAKAQLVLAVELEALVALLAPHLPDGPGPTRRQRALATATLCLGALAVARATRASPLSDEILRAARAFSAPGR